MSMATIPSDLTYPDPSSSNGLLSPVLLITPKLKESTGDNRLIRVTRVSTYYAKCNDMKGFKSTFAESIIALSQRPSLIA